MTLGRAWDRLLGRAPLDEALLLAAEGGPILLHLSDTPSQIYPELRRVIAALRPAYIVHTGDLVDNLKLELRPSLARRYDHELRQLLTIVGGSGARRVILVLGNHDSPESAGLMPGLVELRPDGGHETIEGREIYFSHYPPEARRLAQMPGGGYWLYGHDASAPSSRESGRVALNGLEAMHVINLSSGRYVRVAYPSGTDRARTMPARIGIG
jgi:predicted phosphodiesterase